MAVNIASRMNRMAPSGIRKVNEKALAMEREGKTVIQNMLKSTSIQVHRDRLIP